MANYASFFLLLEIIFMILLCSSLLAVPLVVVVGGTTAGATARGTTSGTITSTTTEDLEHPSVVIHHHNNQRKRRLLNSNKKSNFHHHQHNNYHHHHNHYHAHYLHQDPHYHIDDDHENDDDNLQSTTTTTTSGTTNTNTSSSTLPRIAICIGGQQRRMQPHLLFNGFLNVNRQYRFDLYYNIQVATNSSNPEEKIIYNTDAAVAFNASTFGNMNLTDVIEGLLHIVKNASSSSTTTSTTSNTNIISIQFHQRMSLEDVQRNIGYNLTLFETEAVANPKAQATVLNMYLHQMRCIDQIRTYEFKHSFQYDYIISTREDVIFILPLNLTYALSILDEPFPAKDETLQLLQQQNKSIHLQRKCHMVMKHCANFYGFNQRFFIYDRESAYLILSNRWKYYQKLLSEKVVLYNPEVYEVEMAKFYGLRGCPIHINHYAVTAVRPVDGDIYCYPYWEIFKCIPYSPIDIITEHRCENWMPPPE